MEGPRAFGSHDVRGWRGELNPDTGIQEKPAAGKKGDNGKVAQARSNCSKATLLLLLVTEPKIGGGEQKWEGCARRRREGHYQQKTTMV